MALTAQQAQQLSEIRTIVGDLLTIVNGALGGAGGGWVGTNFTQVKNKQQVHDNTLAAIVAKLQVLDDQVS